MSESSMNGFMTYKEAALIYKFLSDADAAATIKATVEYYLTGKEPELTGTPAEVFSIMKAGVDRGRVSWEKQRAAGRKGNEIRWGKRSGSDRKAIGKRSGSDRNQNQNQNYNLSSCCDSAGAECNEARKKRTYPHDSVPYKAAMWLSEDIRTKTPQVKPHSEATIQAWADNFRLLNERDGYDWDTINAVLTWARDDEFWSKNILSGRKFREQFEALLIKSGVST